MIRLDPSTVRRLGARGVKKLSTPAVRRLGWCSCCKKAWLVLLL